MASASLDGTVAVWDVRSLVRPLALFAHPLPTHGVEWAPTGDGRLLTTGMDDKLRIFEPGTNTASLTIEHNTQTGGWVAPFRAVWSPLGDGLLCGGMDHRVHVYSASSTGESIATLFVGALTAIPTRVTSMAGAVACTTGKGRVHLLSQ
jgi:WD40 repeat protein